ncbi:MAG: cytochrome c biogenesis protein CcsA [Selenomonas noxia]
MIGTVLLVSTLLFAFAAAFCDTQGKTRQAAVAAYLAGIAAIGAAATLFVAILGDDFSVAYVISYSSIDLPLLYKFSAFWAGQQGSFLLWLAIHACVGILLVRSGRMTAAGRSIYHLLTAMLTVLVLIKSPFVPADVIVFDGHGMNPLLQDPWMAVHPPIIFAGYALIAVPFVYSIESMIKNPMDGDFLIPMRRWTLIAWAFLGAGIFIGGYWAYKVLGWGGYWGWDPVENSSLVPWLLACVLLHLISVARERCGAFYLVHLAAIFSYAFVLYGTFLTRSGILGDFSVHSFAGSEIGLYIALANAVVLLFGLGILTVRIERLPKGAVYEQHHSRDFFVLLGMLLIVFIVAIVFFGMSMPLISGLLGESAAVDTSYYVRTSLPIAVPLVLLMALGVLLPYGSGRIARPVWIFVISVGGGILAGLVGATDILSVLLSTFAVLAVAAAIEAFRRQQIGLGGMVAHVGAGLAFLAFILSGTGSQTTTVILIPDEPQEVYGHTIIYRGQMFAESGNEKSYRYEVDGVLYEAVTKLRANGEDAAREPAIARSIVGDLYIAPSPTSGGRAELILHRGKTVMGINDYAYRYESLAFEPQGSGKTLVTAQIALTDGEEVDDAAPTILATETGGTSQPIEVMNGKFRIRLTGVSADERDIRIEILPSEAEEASLPVSASVSTKPGISILWLACVLVTVGGLLAAAQAENRGKGGGSEV